MKRIMAWMLISYVLLSLLGCTDPEQTAGSTQRPMGEVRATQAAKAQDAYSNASLSVEERVADLLGKMTLQDKAGQMVQGEQYAVKGKDMKALGLGSVLSGGGSVPGGNNTISNWQKTMDMYQENALARKLPIPFLYGIDAVHGHNTVYGAVVFPHNIGCGAANDPQLMFQMGEAVAEEMKLTKTLWNFAPCVAVAQDPRWGRTYESFSSDARIVASLSTAFAKGQLSRGVMPTAKHYLADGGTTFGTGEGDYLIDRGDAQMTEAQLRATHLLPYRALVQSGIQIVMPSFSSFQGTKMHENKFLLTHVLKDELGFKGFVISDWEAVNGLSKDGLEEKVIAAVNAGVDMLMQPYNYAETIDVIIKAVQSGTLSQERVDDAVVRILSVKMRMGLFDDPYLKNKKAAVSELGSPPTRMLAKELVQKSLVLLKNDDQLLPLKKGQTIFVTGPAMDDIGVQCGGWTLSWQGVMDGDGKKITPGHTILDGLEAYAEKNDLKIITDAKKASEADVVLLAIGEKPYAEYEGDTQDLSITGKTGLEGNKKAIEYAASLHKPVVTLVVAGRNVIIKEYMSQWDSIVMCYLPGSQGEGIASVLVGEVPFLGKLPMPWYKDVEDIGKKDATVLFTIGFGLTYPKQ